VEVEGWRQRESHRGSGSHVEVAEGEQKQRKASGRSAEVAEQVRKVWKRSGTCAARFLVKLEYLGARERLQNRANESPGLLESSA
jgi:hypothetical protein